MNKSYYKIGEVSEMLGVTIQTLYYWEKEFDELRPPRVHNHRRYTPADVETVRRIKELLYVRKYKVAAAKELMHGYRKGEPRGELKCKSKTTALTLLGEIKTMTQNEHILVRAEAIERWMRSVD